MRDMTISESHKFTMVQSLIAEGAAPIYFDSTGMTALYFINSLNILEILSVSFENLFEWQDWWAR